MSTTTQSPSVSTRTNVFPSHCGQFPRPWGRRPSHCGPFPRPWERRPSHCGPFPRPFEWGPSVYPETLERRHLEVGSSGMVFSFSAAALWGSVGTIFRSTTTQSSRIRLRTYAWSVLTGTNLKFEAVLSVEAVLSSLEWRERPPQSAGAHNKSAGTRLESTGGGATRQLQFTSSSSIFLLILFLAAPETTVKIPMKIKCLRETESRTTLKYCLSLFMYTHVRMYVLVR